ncbi:MAG: alpha/beta family hydrolase [Cyclobacteriaceae bacterium]
MAAKTTELKIAISENLGDVSALAMVPTKAKALLVLAHGAGADMTHKFMEDVAEEFYTRDVATLRYNFPYMEKGGRRPDPPAIAEKTVSQVVAYAHKQFPKLKIFAGGKSFGGRMTSQRFSKESPDYLNGIVFFGFPLHAIGNPSIDRAAHLKDVKVPMLFLQGTKDKLAEINLIKKVVKGLKLGTINIFENADHSFKVPKQNILPDLVESAVNWINAKK